MDSKIKSHSINSVMYDIKRTMSESKGKYTCEACGVSFYLHEDLVRHNANAHGASIGTQLRQSEEIKKQRERE
jgi:hypothetical protein